MIHENEDRILEEWAEAKIITAKRDCEVGNHYHKIKTEAFLLMKGIALYGIDDNGTRYMDFGKLVMVYPNQMHYFKLTKGSVLIGFCSHPYDPTDDYVER